MSELCFGLMVSGFCVFVLLSLLTYEMIKG